MEHNLDKKYQKELLSYQIGHTNNLIRVIKNNNVVLDASDTGTGKTYTAIACCGQLKLSPIIICPKSIISVWNSVCQIFKVVPFMIVNYESIRIGKYYVDGFRKRVKCPYVSTNSKNKFIWNLNNLKNIVFIFDEVHKCSNVRTLNGSLLFASKETKYPIIMISATIADNPIDIAFFLFILNFIDPKVVEDKKIDFLNYMKIVNNWIIRDPKPMLRIHKMLYPERASRMAIDVLGDLFPETQITAVPYYIGKKKEIEIEKEYQIILEMLDELKNKTKKDVTNILVQILRSQQRIELLKTVLFVELANEYLHGGYSVVIFVNFVQTLEALSELLVSKCLIQGSQTLNEREKNINNFQNNKEKLMIAIIKAGSIGISLHDLDGRHPRVSLISPTWDAILLTQTLGRVHRAGGKSKSLQRIVYVANTVEEKIAEKIKKKLKNISEINDGDIDLTNIVYEQKPIHMS